MTIYVITLPQTEIILQGKFEIECRFTRKAIETTYDFERITRESLLSKNGI
jgi:hypothetical protein